jgi:hypothetical protein
LLLHHLDTRPSLTTAGYAVALEAGLAGAVEATSCVDALSVGVAVVGAVTALIRIYREARVGIQSYSWVVAAICNFQA